MYSKPLLSVCLVLLVGACLSRSGLADSVSNFSIGGADYACYGNLICLGDAHIYTGNNTPKSFRGTLSLTHVDSFELDAISAGIAYYHQPVRLLDPSTQRSASFNTSFRFYQVPPSLNVSFGPGDGMTFVLSANNSTLGAGAQSFGFFDDDGTASFKSVVVEFVNYYNRRAPMNNIGWNHISFDFQNRTPVVAKNASDVNIDLSVGLTYAWVEYSAETQKLEVRISDTESRPSSPFLSYTVNLFDLVEEYMWVGFTAGNGLFKSSYYVGNYWEFESYGIPAEVSEPPKVNSSNHLGAVVGYTVGASVLVVALVLISAFCCLRKRRAPDGRRGFLPLWWDVSSSSKFYGTHQSSRQVDTAEGYRFSYEELIAATRSFSEDGKLGEGGFGSVYRGVLPISNLPVAVKKVTRESEEGEKEFKAEVSIISQLRHRNLIRLLGWCIDGGKYYIVYDLMPNGSLDKVLFGPKHDMVLSWPQRFHIIRGTAAAVEYLHQGWNQQVIHRDIKASNIMLDDQWNAKLGDFGLARLADHQRTPSTTIVAGTYGYIAPEAISSRRFTEKTDVFAFGALALEVACGRKSLALHLESEEAVLVDWVWQRLSEGELLSVVDKRLGEYDKDQMEALLLLGLLCSHPDPMARPPMRKVGQVLFGDVPVPFVPVSKPSPVYNNFVSNMDGHTKSMAEKVGFTTESSPRSSPKIFSKSTGSFSRTFSKSRSGTDHDTSLKLR